MVKIANSMGLPLEDVYLGFISGAPFKPELLQRIMESYTLSDKVDYVSAMQSVRNILNNVTHGVWKNEVYTIETNSITLTSVEKMLMVRYINICHHGTKTIVVNDEVLFVPQALQGFSEEEVMKYLKFRLDKLSYYKLGEKLVKEPKMDRIDPVGPIKTKGEGLYPDYHPKITEAQSPPRLILAGTV